MPIRGILLCLASAAAFGAMGVFGKRAYDEGATVGTLLAVRFAVAGARARRRSPVATGALRAPRPARRRPRRGPRRDRLQRPGGRATSPRSRGSTPALLSLLVYTFPVIVAVAAAALGRERAGRRTAAALALSSAGLVLVVAGAGAGALDPLGAALGLVAACVYAAYVLVSRACRATARPARARARSSAPARPRRSRSAPPPPASCAPRDVTPAGFGWLVAIALVSTVGALALFFAGLPLVGPTAASILSTARARDRRRARVRRAG